MKVLLFLSLSAALLCTVISTNHGGEHDDDPSDDHGHRKHGNNYDDHHKNHGNNGKGKCSTHHHDHTNELTARQKFAAANSNFAFTLIRQIAAARPSENILCSPISISTAFAMLSKGAKAKTHDQILEGLGFNNSEFTEKEIHSGFQNLWEVLNNPNSELQLSSGNTLFVDKNLTVLQSFLHDVSTNYASEAFSIDFENCEKAKNEINSYVERKTNGKITQLLSRVDQATELILSSYFYFRGKWEKPFDERLTKEGDFHVDKDTVLKVPFMRRTGMYNVLLSKDVVVVEIPYKGNASALFILPKNGKVTETAKTFQESTIKTWKSKFQYRPIDLSIPKFSISGSINIIDPLSDSGIKDVFSDCADLSGITNDVKLKLTKAVHKAVLSIDETGTEVAGATAMKKRSTSRPPPINFDRPFFMTIYEGSDIVFFGQTVNPVAN